MGRHLRRPDAVLIYPNTSANRLRTSRTRLLPEFAKCYRRHCHGTLGHRRQGEVEIDPKLNKMSPNVIIVS